MPEGGNTVKYTKSTNTWYDVQPALADVWPRWTVTMKRGTGTPWTVYADHHFGSNPQPF